MSRFSMLNGGFQEKPIGQVSRSDSARGMEAMESLRLSPLDLRFREREVLRRCLRDDDLVPSCRDLFRSQLRHTLIEVGRDIGQ